ncbi:MAG: hypothetical protein J4N96_02895 [Chloroflexi bacterium]|nr:hypothetical protein [Chloroflexota bacterium]
MLSRGVGVQAGKPADATGSTITGAFLDGWNLTFRVPAAITAVAQFAAVRTKVYTRDPEDE